MNLILADAIDFPVVLGIGLGTVCAGEQFVTLTPRFLKRLEDRR